MFLGCLYLPHGELNMSGLRGKSSEVISWTFDLHFSSVKHQKHFKNVDYKRNIEAAGLLVLLLHYLLCKFPL